MCAWRLSVLLYHDPLGACPLRQQIPLGYRANICSVLRHPKVMGVTELSPEAVGCGRRQVRLLSFWLSCPWGFKFIYRPTIASKTRPSSLQPPTLFPFSPQLIPCSRRRRLSCPHQSPWTKLSERYSLGRSLHLCDCWGLVIIASPNLTKCLVSMAQPGYKSIPIILITAQRIGYL
jgi:hypothetical protein